MVAERGWPTRHPRAHSVRRERATARSICPPSAWWCGPAGSGRTTRRGSGSRPPSTTSGSRSTWTGASVALPGLYFVGVHFLEDPKSSLLLGVGEDAALVARQVAGRHRAGSSSRGLIDGRSMRRRPDATRDLDRTLSFGLVTIPVRMFNATEAQDVRFHQLERETGRRIRYVRTTEAEGFGGDPWWSPPSETSPQEAVGDRSGRGGPGRRGTSRGPDGRPAVERRPGTVCGPGRLLGRGEGVRGRPRPVRDRHAGGAPPPSARDDPHDRHRGLRRARRHRPGQLRAELRPRPPVRLREALRPAPAGHGGRRPGGDRAVRAADQGAPGRHPAPRRGDRPRDPVLRGRVRPVEEFGNLPVRAEVSSARRRWPASSSTAGHRAASGPVRGHVPRTGDGADRGEARRGRPRRGARGRRAAHGSPT